MWERAVENYVQLISSADASYEDVYSAAQQVIKKVPREPRPLNAALQRLLPALQHEHPIRAGITAMMCGGLIEDGGDASIVRDAILSRLPETLEMAYQFAEACQEEIDSEHDEDQEESHEEGNGFPDEIEERVAELIPRFGAAWHALNFFWPPWVLLLSGSPHARQDAQPSRTLADSLADYHEAGYWLSLILDVLDQDPVLIIEPGSMKGFEARISGISDNFQLQMMLMAELIGNPEKGWLEGEPLPEKLAAVARGEGPQELEESVSGQWNMYAWQAISPDGTLPEPDDFESSDYWIWGEGRPAEIPVFEGYRVILLGPQAYPRFWPATRMFARLPASLMVENHLGEAACAEWLQKMAKQRPQVE